jgi:hypothetical protein
MNPSLMIFVRSKKSSRVNQPTPLTMQRLVIRNLVEEFGGTKSREKKPTT